LIEESNSQYSCSPFIVRSHAEVVRGKAGMVINYKPLNAITKGLQISTTVTRSNNAENTKVQNFLKI